MSVVLHSFQLWTCWKFSGKSPLSCCFENAKTVRVACAKRSLIETNGCDSHLVRSQKICTRSCKCWSRQMFRRFIMGQIDENWPFRRCTLLHRNVNRSFDSTSFSDLKKMWTMWKNHDFFASKQNETKWQREKILIAASKTIEKISTFEFGSKFQGKLRKKHVRNKPCRRWFEVSPWVEHFSFAFQTALKWLPVSWRCRSFFLVLFTWKLKKRNCRSHFFSSKPELDLRRKRLWQKRLSYCCLSEKSSSQSQNVENNLVPFLN